MVISRISTTILRDIEKKMKRNTTRKWYRSEAQEFEGNFFFYKNQTLFRMKMKHFFSYFEDSAEENFDTSHSEVGKLFNSFS